ncbi:hypothetical protein M409DRAFT_17935 [Zasmidium cellare ATCC 36951]|uniref:Heterokaryon incompatibility domain-containing protein n=1 Tax=Zasmidium cellare ATCC 36951 TaxID=1080233 RepID=A0A6A6CZV7_ZASCE|nr:uncharacterized protein M409DRAFT_17935 [Zasmidium cellare ATCC 36951]KAF2171698.1 hypothetical protein M409DRAFT_17935 [Zasmidium cellare ATCC 36951]
MSTFKLETDILPHFQAISYTWGDPHDQRQILVNGNPVLVRKNCHYALWQARLHHEGHIWIDSVCINQEDPQEKGSQVSIMARIFASATKTVACIGPQTDHSRFLFDLCRESDELETTTMGTLEPQEAEYRAKDWLASKDLDRICESISKFGNRPYWSRLWIVQELHAATTISFCCGEDTMEWDIMRKLQAIYDFLKQKDVSPKVAYDIEATPMINLIRILNNIGGIGTRGLLTRLWKLECEDKRDRVYGILSMVEWPSACAPIVPDYQKDAVQLALDFMDYILASGGTLRHISALLQALGITDSMLPQVNASSKPCEWYCYGLERAYRISTDSFGELNIRFQATRSRIWSSRYLPLESPSHHVRTVLFSNTRIEAALVSEYVQEGDIILVGGPYAICVRPLSDSTEFEWLGPVLMSEHLLRVSSTRDRLPTHREGKGTRLEDLHFRFQLTKEEILMLATDDSEHFGRLVSGGLPSVGRRVQVGHRGHSILHSDQDWSVYVTQLADQ